MKNPHLNLLAAICLALPLAIALSPVTMAQEGSGCLSGREAQQAFEARRIISLKQAMDAAGRSKDRIINQSGPRLCDVDGKPYWQVNVQGQDGNYETIDLPAQGD